MAAAAGAGEGAPLYLPFFQTSYGNSFGYTERTKANAQVFENRTMHPTWRGSYRLTDLSGEQIAQPLRSSYNAKIKVAQWPKPKSTRALPPASPGSGSARLSASNGALNASNSSFSSTGSGFGGGAAAGKSSAAPDAYPEADEFSAPAAAAAASPSRVSRVQIASPRDIASPPPVRPASASQRNGVDVKHSGTRARPQSAGFGGGAAAAAGGTQQQQALAQAQVNGVLTARDLRRLEFYSEKFGANVSFHSTSRPQLHHHQRSVMVRNRVRPDDDPLNQNRLEAEANWDKWSISRFHRGMQGRVPGYTGYVPRIQFINGETYGRATRVAFGGPRDVGRPRTPVSKNGLVRGNAPGAQQPQAPTQQIDFDPLLRTA